MSSRRRITLILSVLLLVSMACTLPGLGRQTPTAAPTLAASATAAVAAATPTALPELPPALVETDPPVGSDLGPQAALTFYFNQPMDAASVEAALQSQPALDGRAEWVDDATLRYQPGQPYTAGSQLRITLADTAQAANGLGMSAPVSLEYHVADRLQVSERLPQPGLQAANPSSAVVATFNVPVVPLGAEAASLVPAFTLQPQAEGRGEWLNTSTYIFYPQPALAGGVQYTVHFDPALSSVAGVPLDLSGLDPADWTFTTALPQVTGLEFGAQDRLELDGQLNLSFNQPMDTASVEQNLALLDPQGSSTPLEFSWNERGDEVTFHPRDLLARAVAYTVRLDGAARSLGGAALGAPYTFTKTSVPALAVEATYPAAGEPINANYGLGFLQINFTAPLAAQDFEGLVNIEPAVNSWVVSRSEDGYSLSVQGSMQPSSAYTITLATDLRDRWGGTLAAPVTIPIITETPPPSLSIPVTMVGAPAIFVPAGQTSLTVSVTNVNQVGLQRRSLGLDEFIRQIGTGAAAQSDAGATSWEQTLSVPTDRNVNAALSLDPRNRPLSPGLYWLRATPAGLDASAANSYLLVASHVQLTFKLSQRQGMVWAVDLVNNQPMAGLALRFLSADGQEQLGACTTDADGLCATELSARENLYDAVYAVAGLPGDADFAFVASTMNQGLSPWESGLPTDYQPDGPFAYLYTDRPIYRPGQTVNFKAVLRQKENGRYSALDLDTVEAKIMPPYDSTLSEQLPIADLRLSLSAYGTVDGSVELPADAQTGYYSIMLEDLNSSLTFQVAEYRKPEFDLQAAFVDDEAMLGGTLKAHVSALYYFGAPVSDLPVHWALYAQSEWPVLPDGLQAGPLDDSWLTVRDMYAPMLGNLVTQGDGVTAADGQLDLSLPGSLFADQNVQNRTRLTLEVTATDESNLPVSVRATSLLHPARFYVGVKPESWSAQAGEELGFSVRALDWANQPAGQHSLTAVFSRVVWQRDDAALSYGYPAYRKEVTPISSANLRTDAAGEARVVFTPPDAGVYQMEIVGEGALTQVLVWAAGPGAAIWPSLSNQSLRLEADAEEYRPGDTATLRIPNPYSGSALAWITVERSQVMRSYVQRLDASLVEFALPIQDIDAPNVYVSVTLLGETDGGQPDYRQGYLNLAVHPDALQLNVQLAFDPASAGPGQAVHLGVLVTAADGQPAQGEFSLALVDKAVLALADANEPGILEAFYGQQPLSVQTSLDLSSASSRSVIAQLGRGGGGDMAVSPGERTEFKDTAIWVAAFETDAEGQADLLLTLPDNLTTWVADVRGLNGDGQVGAGSAELVVRKDLLVRPVAPRFFVAGDRVQLGAIVQNNTTTALSVDVSLEAPGLTLEDPDLASQAVEVPAQGRMRVNWWAEVQDVPSIDPVFAARSGQLEDVTHTEAGDLPVLRYRASSTSGTAGVLAEGGSRLEVVSLPRSFTPTGGTLSVELSPSLAATVIQSLTALESFPDDFTEPIISRLMANAAAYRALKVFDLQAPDLQDSLARNVRADLRQLFALQDYDGGWNWGEVSATSDPRLTAYALIALAQAGQAGFFVSPDTLQRGQDYLAGQLAALSLQSADEDFENQALEVYALAQSGRTGLDLETLYDLRERLSPSAKALLALSLRTQDSGDERAGALLSDLAGLADRSASGASWQPMGDGWSTWSTPVFTTAVVSQALATLDPASTLLPDALRYLTLQRRSNGCWASSYESAWVILALSQALQSTGDLQASFGYQASLNGSVLASGSAEGAQGVLNPVTASAPLSQLLADSPNALEISRDTGEGRLYYRAFLQVDRPAADVPALSRGISVQRQYFAGGEDCRAGDCQPVEQAELGSLDGLLVRLTITLPKAMYYVVVEDAIPAGAEVIDPNLKTSRLGFTESGPSDGPVYDLADPFRDGWGWWYFGAAQIHDDSVRWMARYLPAGTYTLSYRLSPSLAGDFQGIPAHAYQYYFPDVEGRSAGDQLSIR